MVRKFLVSSVLAAAVLLAAGCHHKVQNPLANVDSKQPDKALYDRALDSLKHGRYQESRTLLETLINAYPDSEYLAQAKLAVGDSWYQEGGTAAWQQAEAEYKDFQTFFPNLPEASEAQLKVANIHYRQMEKPDRDFKQATRAADEYKTLIQTYPDSPLVPEARQRLREVEEVLAERQFRIANFYYLRQNYAASQARLKSLVDSYPLYSRVDDALFELGQLYEKEAEALKRQNIPEAEKEKVAADFQKQAIDAYSQIITRHPAMHRVDDAKKELAALNATIPVPTPEAIAASKAEEESRRNISMMQGLMGNFKSRPMVVRRAPRVGDPNMQQEEVVSAPAMVKDLQNQLNAGGQADGKVGIQAVAGITGRGSPGPNQPPPGVTTANAAAPAGTDAAPPPAAPAQVNEVHADQNSANSAQSAPAAGGPATKLDKKKESTSKKKKKKGWSRLNPF